MADRTGPARSLQSPQSPSAWPCGSLRSRSLDWRNRAVVASAMGLLPFAVRYSRVIPMFILVALVVIARAWENWRPEKQRPDQPTLIALAGIFIVAAIGWTLSSWIRDDPTLEWHPLPAQAVAAAHACGGPLHNRFDDGGYLNWFAQGIPNFVDGRVDPFPKSFLKQHLSMKPRATTTRPSTHGKSAAPCYPTVANSRPTRQRQLARPLLRRTLGGPATTIVARLKHRTVMPDRRYR